VFAQFEQVWIFSEPFEVAIAVFQGLFEGSGGLGHFAGEAKTAGEVVINQRVARPEDGETLVDFESKRKFPALGVVIPQDLQGIYIPWIALNEAFQKPDLDVEITLLLAVKLLPDRRFFRHNIAAQFVTISSLEVKRVEAPNLKIFGEQNMYRIFPDFKVGAS
jgi:hypothetical protein